MSPGLHEAVNAPVATAAPVTACVKAVGKPRVDRGDWQLHPGVFSYIQAAFAAAGFPLSLDCAARDDLGNAQLAHACTPHKRSYLAHASRPWVRRHRGLWCNPPYSRVRPFVRAFASDIKYGCYGAFLCPSWRHAEVMEVLGDLAMTAGTWPAGADIYLAPERTHSGVTYVFKGTPNWGSALVVCLPSVEAMERVCAGIREAFGNQYPSCGLLEGAVRAAWVPRRCDGVAWAAEDTLGTQKARHLTLTGCFGGHPCNVIIDTGATRTFVSDAWVKQHNVTSLLPSLGVHVQPAAGHNVHCMHECTFELQLGHWHAPVTALVFPGAHFDMLLGMDVLDAHDAILHAARRTLSMRVGGCRHTIFCRRLLALSMHTYAANGGRCTTASVLPSGDHPLPLALAQSSGPGLGHAGPLGSVATGPPPPTTHHPPPPILSSPCQPCKPPPSSGPGLGHSPPPLANHARPLDSVTAGPPPPPTGHPPPPTLSSPLPPCNPPEADFQSSQEPEDAGAVHCMQGTLHGALHATGPGGGQVVLHEHTQPQQGIPGRCLSFGRRSKPKQPVVGWLSRKKAVRLLRNSPDSVFWAVIADFFPEQHQQENARTIAAFNPPHSTSAAEHTHGSSCMAGPSCTPPLTGHGALQGHTPGDAALATVLRDSDPDGEGLPVLVSERLGREPGQEYNELLPDPDPIYDVEAIVAPAPIKAVLRQFAQVAQEPDTMPPTRPGIDHKIPLTDPNVPPAARRGWRFSQSEYVEAKKQIEKFLKKGWVRHSVSPWSAPVLFAKKKGGGLRMCIDYRGLNAVTVRDRGPIPQVGELLDKLSGAKYFTRLDLYSGYHQIQIQECDRPKTAFTCSLGHFEWNVVPFGLTSAPATFQRAMHKTLWDCLNEFVVVYIDDICIYSQSLEEHAQHLATVLERMSAEGWRLNLAKCEFAVQETVFLGFKVSGTGVKPDPLIIQSVVDWPRPTNLTEVRGFLSLCSFFRRFVRQFSEVAKPLIEMTKADFSGEWTQAAEQAFISLKHKLIHAPVLAPPDYTKPFIITTDCSDYGCGAILTQAAGQGGPEDAERVVAFHSRKLAPAETRYHARERECLGIIDAIRVWRHYIEGGPHEWVVRTDHESLKHLLTQDIKNARQARWVQLLQEYMPFTIQYIKGPTNPADPLSRRPDYALPAVITAEAASIASMLQAAYRADPRFSRPEEGGTGEIAGAYLREDGFWAVREHQGQGIAAFGSGTERIVVPSSARTVQGMILRACHSSTTSGHLGIRQTTREVMKRWAWVGCRAACDAFVRSCPACQKGKHVNYNTQQPIQPLPIPQGPWQWVTLDLAVALPRTARGHDSILVMVDRFSKMALLKPTSERVTAPGVARLFSEAVIAHFGIPLTITSDRDPRLTGNFWPAFMSALGVDVKMSTAYHPQTDGQSERTIRTVVQMLRVTLGHDKEWDTKLPGVQFAYNHAVHSAHGRSPFFVAYGWEPLGPPDLLSPALVPAAQAAAEAITGMHAAVKEQLHKAAQRMVQQGQSRVQRSIPAGSHVLVAAHIFSYPPGMSRKLMPPWLGPFLVLEERGNTCKLQLPPHLRLHSIINKQHLRVFTPDTQGWHSRAQAQVEGPDPQPVGGALVAERCVDWRVGRGQLREYKFRYKDRDHSEDRWLRGGDLSELEQQLADAFERQQVADRAAVRAKWGLRSHTAVAVALQQVEPPTASAVAMVAVATASMWESD